MVIESGDLPARVELDAERSVERIEVRKIFCGCGTLDGRYKQGLAELPIKLMRKFQRGPWTQSGQTARRKARQGGIQGKFAGTSTAQFYVRRQPESGP